MKTKYIMLALALALGSLAAMAQTQDDDQRVRDKITEAVMRVYNKHLAENPGDYNTMFARANQYYYNGQIDEALADVNTILTLIPAQDNDLRFETMLLRARLYDIKGDYAQEIIDLKAANGLNPSSPAVNEPLAKAYLNSGDPDNADSRNYYYYTYEWTWAYEKMIEFFKLDPDTITASDIIRIVERWKDAVIGLDKMVYEDAKKEFSLSSMTGFGADGTKFEKEQDFEQVRGDFESNPFVTAVLDHIKVKTALGNELIERLKPLTVK